VASRGDRGRRRRGRDLDDDERDPDGVLTVEATVRGGAPPGLHSRGQLATQWDGRHLFITFEGPEGAGKTTQADALRSTLEGEGRQVVLVREPGGTPLGERVRALLLERGEDAARIAPRADALLFNAARAQLVEDVIAPALARGAIVISDRFADSTLAYQGFAAGLPVEDLRALARVATGGLRPDLTILLDLPPASGLERKAGDETRFEEFDQGFHERVRQGFLTLAGEEPERFSVVDARLPAADVREAVLGAARRALARASAPTASSRSSASSASTSRQ
jgi:dTMP kinase